MPDRDFDVLPESAPVRLVHGGVRFTFAVRIVSQCHLPVHMDDRRPLYPRGWGLHAYAEIGSDPDFSSLAGLDPGLLHYPLVALGIRLYARDELLRRHPDCLAAGAFDEALLHVW
jgi:hypothetical protein